VSNKHEEY